MLSNEVWGIIAAIFVFMSMCFETKTLVGTLHLRATNIIGSALFVIYGFKITAYTTIILNVIMIFINMYYMIIARKEFKKNVSR